MEIRAPMAWTMLPVVGWLSAWSIVESVTDMWGLRKGGGGVKGMCRGSSVWVWGWWDGTMSEWRGMDGVWLGSRTC